MELFRIAALKQSFRFEQKSVIKFSMVEKNKIYEIYRRICDVYREECFLKKNQEWVKNNVAKSEGKRQFMELKYTDSLAKKKFWYQ